MAAMLVGWSNNHTGKYVCIDMYIWHKASLFQYSIYRNGSHVGWLVLKSDWGAPPYLDHLS